MTKRLSYMIAILIALTIGSVQTIRISQTYFNNEPQLKTVEAPMDYYQEQYPAMMAPPEDTVYTQEEPERGEALEEDNSNGSGWVPSDRALETKFWLDSIGSFLTTVAPIIVPVIAFRKKSVKEDINE